MSSPSSRRRVTSAGPIAIVTLLSMLIAPLQCLAQQTAPPAPTPVQTGAGKEEPERGFFKALLVNLGDDVKHIPRKNSLYWLGAGAALALAIHPLDEEINTHLQGSGVADRAFKPGRYIGSFPFLLATSIATYAVGRGKDQPRVKHLGSDLIEATLLSEGITVAVKAMVRRDRPVRADGTMASGFSFPSGHASATFATATVLQQHLGWKAAVPTYLVASFVATSRLHDERHFVSDVVAGAAQGIIIGRAVTWHGRNFYGTPVVGSGKIGMMFSVVP